ncbi:hypothetical protein PN466_20400 [Roseofilum reptotaenium CS-1145]|uniref:Peptidase C39-like domain-containing protein n=1 Tax=Roseofilum reptotaenium AO1-A TaxID=1925591 RepID=A0A1L9QX06_9CYAN|nr:hypothetical protein [Roseofilum reptotaenium]MDB9519311.1 hypothetical protein [Roseofilum reptotaenium CS-1145]OJJ27194.1 hypothetical protein BI308_01515 [Roseofilum reptotaenium AO1-A]
MIFKKKKTEDDNAVRDINPQTLNNESGWQSLSPALIHQAQQLPAQKESWSCGPNSAYRALCLNGQHTSAKGLQSFIENCPVSLGGHDSTKIGPTPSKLAKYIDNYTSSSVNECSCVKWNSFWPAIQGNLGKHPSLVLVQFSTFKLHYVNVVGYNSHSKEVAILDTNNSLEAWTIEQFRHLTAISAKYLSKNYYAIHLT